MNRDTLWLGLTALAIAASTLGVLGLLAHLDDGRNASVIAFDVLWVIGALLIGQACWKRTRWG